MTAKEICARAALAIAVLLGGIQAYGQINAQTDPPSFSPLGVLTGETIRLSAWCVAVTDVPPGPCSVDLAFIDFAGRVLKVDTRSIPAGQGAFLDLMLPVAARPVRLMVLPFFKVRGRGLGA